TLTTLNLCENLIDAEGIKHLAHALSKNKTLTSLSLVSNIINVDGAKYLADGLQHNQVKLIL
ncbi:unnamed protein product, partial [Rotaria sp. Silwood1]